MQRLGLALSGGGFRAALYHLGVVRFLRDAGLLSQVTHITSVSGGSVLGAHLVLNWDRYCGSDDEFQEVAEEMLRLLQLDVRNRIVRRFPLASLANMGRRAFRMPTRRQFTRSGLLEQHYEKHLYGDTSLFNLPENPQLYILATNLSEGSLCAFYRKGLLMQRRAPGRRTRFEEVRIGLATVPMAVAASSAFPGFFPPLELKSWDVGAKEGDFSRHAFTDGGIYDNVGLRMFDHIQQTSMRDDSVIGLEDVLDDEAMASALTSGSAKPKNHPMRRLWDKLSALDPDITATRSGLDSLQNAKILTEGLGAIIRNEELYLDPAFRDIALLKPRAQALIKTVNSSKSRPQEDDHTWLNRQFVEAALESAAGKPCLRSGENGFDGIMVSDAGATFKVRAEGGRAGGLMSTAMRSTDILMDRVNQLELESFRGAHGVLFFPITSVVEPSQDPYAPHPEVQHHASLIRTDMDAFSDLEVSALVQHGYCVARQACRDQALLPASDLPSGPPWNPLTTKRGGDVGSRRSVPSLSDEASALQTARELQKSSSRKIFRTLLSFSDWPTYIWIPLIATLLLTLPYLLYQSRKTAIHRGYVLSAVEKTSPLYSKILSLIEQGPIDEIDPVEYEEVTTMEPANLAGFEVLSDNRILDLRGWISDSTGRDTAPYLHSTCRVRRLASDEMDSHLRIQFQTVDKDLLLDCRNPSLRPRYRRMQLPNDHFQWELELDFTGIPVGDDTELVFEGVLSSDLAALYPDGGQFQFNIFADTGLAQIWMLMPTNRLYKKFEISGWPLDQPEQTQTIIPTTTVDLPIGSISTFQMINPRHDFRYECRWDWDNESE